MKRAGKIIKWLLPPGALLGALFTSLAVYDAATGSRPFLTTSSPGGAYAVNLTGRKERPFLFPNTVSYHVLKGGQPFLPSRPLHSASDFMDLSFEAGYPDFRWVNESTIQLYLEQHLKDDEPDALVVVNETEQAIKYLEVHSVDKFLLFDLQPGAATELSNSRPRSDYKSVSVSGEFLDGRSIGKGWAALKPARGSARPFTYRVYVRGDGVVIEGPRP
jgi:hypothetical protein